MFSCRVHMIFGYFIYPWCFRSSANSGIKLSISCSMAFISTQRCIGNLWKLHCCRCGVTRVNPCGLSFKHLESRTRDLWDTTRNLSYLGDRCCICLWLLTLEANGIIFFNLWRVHSQFLDRILFSSWIPLILAHSGNFAYLWFFYDVFDHLHV